MNPVLDPDFWRKRIQEAPAKHLYQAVYRIVPDAWKLIEDRHATVFQKVVGEDTTICEVGCGYGRSLGLMPAHWKGMYTGIDLSPEFVKMGANMFRDPRFWFVCARAEDILSETPDKVFKLGLTVSVRRMLIDNGHADLWELLHQHLLRTCDRVLTLEYEASSDGVLEP